MNSKVCTAATIVAGPGRIPARRASPDLLHKSRNPAVGSSHVSPRMIGVHAAPVRGLPPPGASPAAAFARLTEGSGAWHTDAVLRRRPMRLRTKVTLFFGLIALVATVTLTVVTYLYARESLIDQRFEVARQQA